MKKLFAPIISIVAFLVVIYILLYVIKPLGDFFAWWFLTKEEINAPITTWQAIGIDAITHLITYASVGVIFGTIGWFDSDAMHVAYVIISEFVALALAILLRFILDYYWIIFIIVGVIVIATITFAIIFKVRNKKKEEAIENA